MNEWINILTYFCGQDYMTSLNQPSHWGQFNWDKRLGTRAGQTQAPLWNTAITSFACDHNALECMSHQRPTAPRPAVPHSSPRHLRDQSSPWALPRHLRAATRYDPRYTTSPGSSVSADAVPERGPLPPFSLGAQERTACGNRPWFTRNSCREERPFWSASATPVSPPRVSPVVELWA